jgi:hypothetical protein
MSCLCFCLQLVSDHRAPCTANHIPPSNGHFFHPRPSLVLHYPFFLFNRESIPNPLLCVQLVFSSSATVYGQPKTVPATEEFPTGAANPYGRTKLFIEEICRDVYAANKDWRIILLRYFNPVRRAATKAMLSCQVLELQKGLLALREVRKGGFTCAGNVEHG